MKYVLVTGAYGGMGKRSTELLRERGYTVLAMDKTVGEAEERIIPIQADVTDEESVKRAFEEVRAQTDTLYAVIHYAGIYMLDSLVEMSTRDFDRIFEVNVRGAFLINKTFLPLLKKGSRILMTTSELADLDPLPFTGIYAITKGALDKYAYSLRMELQLLGIGVSVLRAGAVDTGMLNASVEALDRFCRNTELYPCNAGRFKRIVERVEARHITAHRLACKAACVIEKRSPRFAYAINRNPLLRLLELCPTWLRFRIIGRILK